ncbi:hypothetical protein HS088_TW16G00468 [Tripterygium wilfordii]|uniref:Uncharacterized protein n=1 Tax=Tripterygium wilfordii TaxID=458696 RepID=A0A7J7CIZ1_TRIWF|nr:hypothetical protein HS088_TW16G00468 [Tripterygium wilfordii]
MEAAAATVSPQLSCFFSFNRGSKFQLQRQFVLSPTLRRPKIHFPSLSINARAKNPENLSRQIAEQTQPYSSREKRVALADAAERETVQPQI